MQKKSFSFEIGGQTLHISTGVFAQQSDSAIRIQYGETVVLVTAVMSGSPREGIDFFPLLVDFDEKLYAAGKIKSSRFIKREGRATDEAILAGRLIDRSIRPLFDENLRNDVQIVVTTLSFDHRNDPDILGILGASLALATSRIPWDGPITAIRIGRVEGEYVINPSYEARAKSDFELTLSGKDDRIFMIEAGARQVPERDLIDACAFGLKHMAKLAPFFADIVREVGIEKYQPHTNETVEQIARWELITAKVHAFLEPRLDISLFRGSKEERNQLRELLESQLDETLKADSEVTKEERSRARGLVEDVVSGFVKTIVLDHGQRIDGRAFDEIRPLDAEVKLLPRPHGSGMFQRGETQVLSVVTLGTPSLEQTIDSMEETTKKRYMHHYNFPGFSVGEVAPLRGPGRREIGHGALAEKAILPVLPDKEVFPYAIRVVSEVLSSNGSTSMAATCGSSLALMDAGVPISAAVGGIAMGLFSRCDAEGNIVQYKIVTDIQGYEDFNGGMDFKVAGTKDGITAIQVDVKDHGLPMNIITEAIERARTARMQVLEVMNSAIQSPRPELSPYAPRILTIQIPVGKIRDLIGPGGKMINEIIAATGATIDIEESGLVYIASENEESAQKALQLVKDVTREVVVGEVFTGKVTRILDFGAFVEILPKQEGLVHISELAPFRVGKVEDIVHVGDTLPVKVIEIDDLGRVNLSLKQTDFDFGPFMHMAEAARGDNERSFHHNHRNGQGGNNRPQRRF